MPLVTLFCQSVPGTHCPGDSTFCVIPFYSFDQKAENALSCIDTKVELFRESSVSEAKMPDEGAKPDPVRNREDIAPEVFDGQKYLVRQK